MKRITLVSLLALSMFFVTACGTPALTPTEAPAQAPTMVPTQASTQAPAQAPSQPASTQAAPPGNSTQIDITLADNTIQASQSTFQAGVPYTFVIRNTGRRAHNFNINPPVSVAGSLDAALSGALLAVEREKLSAGATATVEYTFPASAVGQQLQFSCLIKRHYEDGMFQAITVTE